MSGPMAAGFGLEAGVIIAAESIAQGMAEIAADLEAADQHAAARQQQRNEERQQMRAARASGQVQREQSAAWRSQLAGLLGVVDGTGAAEAASRLQVLADGTDSLQAHLARHLAAAQLQPVDAMAERRAMVARVLERLEASGDLPLPPTLDTLAHEIVAAPTAIRAEALASELRLQVQQYNAAAVEAAKQKRRQDAAALVLEQSLKDLGYAVEEIEETLFVEGGVAHFQRPEWGDYFVRLRIDPKRSSMNFNVVRAGTSGEDRKHEDMLAEERWCSAFPKLFETLKARGIPINVTRLLQAGEAPVQVVDAATLPAREQEEHRTEPLKARSIQ